MTAFRHHDGAVWLRLGDADGPDDATRVIDVWRTTVAKLLHGLVADYSPAEQAILDQLASDDNPWQPGGGS